MVVGPLARSDVEQLLKSKPKVRTLSLNDVAGSLPQVWQFSLSKKEDAAALKTLLHKDGIQQLLILRQPGSEAEHELLLMSLFSQSDLKFKIVNKAPIFLMPKQGLLFLGNAEGLATIPELSRKRMYTVANAISEQHKLPQGIKFCDVPVLYLADWPDVLQAYVKEPVDMSYQRLIAFGGDAWQITQQYLSQPRSQNVEFQGRTGRIQITEHGIQRSPQCFQYSGTGVKLL
jgi:hypothetical protein